MNSNNIFAAMLKPKEQLLDLSRNFDHIDYRIAETVEEKEAIYRLRYRAYLAEGAISASSTKLVTDKHDESPASWIFGVYFDDMLASSIRISVATPEHQASPSVNVFPDILKPELAAGKTIVDPSRFVVEPSSHTLYPALPYLTMRIGFAACEYFNADIYLATVRAEHIAFFRRVFLQKPLTEPRPYPGLLKPIALLGSNFTEVKDRIFDRYPYFHSSAFERRMLFRKELDRRDRGKQKELPGARGADDLQRANDVDREATEIISLISDWAGGPEEARLWFRAYRIPAFGGRTSEALVREGRSEEVRRFLDHVARGGYA